MRNPRIICALFGLAGAINNNGKLDTTDEIVIKALSSDDNDQIIEMIHKEKYRISPGCETCISPCGNTSDFNIELLNRENPENLAVKEKMIETLYRYALTTKGNDLADAAYKAISYFGYDLEKESYMKVIGELEKCLEG